MKRKSIVLILALALALSVAFSATACGKNKHEFSAEWKNDGTHHWHECTTKGHTDTTERLPHEFTWTEKTPAGVHTDKVEKGVCECGYETERTISDTATHAYGEEWKKDATGHWHESTCDATAPTHEVMKSDFAEHTFDEGVVAKPADYGVVGEKTFTCTKCGYSYTEEIAALGAKDNEIKLADGKTLGKTYDGQSIAITKENFVIEGNRVPTIMFKVKGADDNAYTATAPTNAGEYTVKVSVEGTAEWKAASKTFDFAIAKKELAATATKVYDGTATMPATLTGVVEGDEVTIAVTMSSVNVDATIQNVEIAGNDAGNYTINKENVSVTITPRKINIKNLEVEYNGKSSFPLVTNEVSDADTKYNLIAGDNISLTLVFNGEKANAGNTQADLTKIDLSGNDAQNYKKPETSEVTVNVITRKLTLKNKNITIFKEGAGNIRSGSVDLSEADGILSGDTGVGVMVKEEALDNTWLAGKTYALTNAAGVMTAGSDSRVNYEVAALENCTVVIKGKTVTLTIGSITDVSDTPISDIIETSFTITVDDTKLSLRADAQEGLCEYLTKAANAKKSFNIRVEYGDHLLATFERRGVHTESDLEYVYRSGSMSFTSGQIASMDFALFKGGDYVSEDGRWTGGTDLTDVKITIEDLDLPVLSEGSLSESSSVGGGQIAVFEVQLPEKGSICTFDVIWTGSPKNIEMVMYDAETGSETGTAQKVGENKFTFAETIGKKSFYLYVKDLDDTSNDSWFTITASFKSSTRLAFSEGADEVSSGELTYAAGEEKRFVIKVGSGIGFGMKYTFSNIPGGATIRVYRDDGTAVTLSADNSFSLPAKVPVRDYTIVVTNITDNNLNVNFSIKKVQTPGGIVIS